jgi:hypothetical protein
MNDPKPCSECGQKAVEQWRTRDGHTEHWVCCRNVGKCLRFFRNHNACTTDIYDSEEKAVEAWDKMQAQHERK